MILTESDAVYAANKFIDYYSQFNRIDDYLRHIKEDRGENRMGYLPGFGADSDMFDKFDVHPNDMNFEVHVVDTDTKSRSKYNQWLYSETLNLTASNPIEEAISICWEFAMKLLKGNILRSYLQSNANTNNSGIPDR